MGLEKPTLPTEPNAPEKSDVPEEPEVLVRRQGAAGRITLNRVGAHNALSGSMVATMRSALAEFSASPSIALVIIDSASPRVFCIGGDLDPVRTFVSQGNYIAALAHCRNEYDLDLGIADHPKPIVTLVDGLVMGGGIGISCHASHPVITERARLALPETGIGWVPDSGINALLAKAPGQAGKYLALTGTKIGAGDVLHMGFARYITNSNCISDLVTALAHTGSTTVLADFAAPHPSSELATMQSEIDRVFANNDLTTIVTKLQVAAAGSWQANALRKIERNSRSACERALEILTKIQSDMPLAETMDVEFSSIAEMIASPEFT